MFKKKEPRFQLKVSAAEQRLIDEMIDKTGVANEYELFINAAVLLQWAIRQAEHGRKIVSMSPDDEQFIELKVSTFRSVKQRYSPDHYPTLIDEDGEWILSDIEVK